MFFETAYNAGNSIGSGNVFGYRDNSTFGLAGLSDRHYGGQYGYRDGSTFGLSDSAYATTGQAVWQTLGYGSKALWKAAGSPGASGPAYGLPSHGVPLVPLNPPTVGLPSTGLVAAAPIASDPSAPLTDPTTAASGGISDLLSGTILGIPIMYLLIGGALLMVMKK